MARFSYIAPCLFGLSSSLSASVRAALLAMLLSAQAFAGGLLWKASTDEHHVYLLGAVHFADASFYPLSKAISKAYEQSDVLLVEVDEERLALEQRQALLQTYGMYPPTDSLSANLDARTRKLASSLAREAGIRFADMERFRPGLFSIILAGRQASSLGYSADLGIDRYFLNVARGEKPVRQIETYEFQMRLLSELPSSGDFFYQLLQEMENFEPSITEMMNAWKAGDAEALYYQTILEPLLQFPALEGYYNKLFYERHPAMLAAIENCFVQLEVCFVAIGAGHFLGDKGLIHMLQEKGYAVQKMQQ